MANHKTFCVWRNADDEIIAIDQPASVCALLMGINLKTFYEFRAKTKKKPGRWTIIASDEIESEEDYAEVDNYWKSDTKPDFETHTGRDACLQYERCG